MSSAPPGSGATFESHLFAGPGRELAIDVFRPTGPALRTAIIVLHGGGLRVGSRQAVYGRAEELAKLGFVAFAAEYRLLGESPWPAPLDDTAATVRWVREHSGEFGIEPDRIVVQGHSAGGYLALLTPGVEPVAAVVAYYPPMALRPEATPAESGGPPRNTQAADGTIPSWQVLGDDLDSDRVAAASPMSQIDRGFPPTLLFHGRADDVLGSFSTVILHDRLVALDVPVDLHLYAHGAHEFDLTPAMRVVTCAETAAFVRRHVVDPEGARAEDAIANPFAARAATQGKQAR